MEGLKHLFGFGKYQSKELKEFLRAYWVAILFMGFLFICFAVFNYHYPN